MKTLYLLLNKKFLQIQINDKLLLYDEIKNFFKINIRYIFL